MTHGEEHDESRVGNFRTVLINSRDLEKKAVLTSSESIDILSSCGRRRRSR